MEPSARKSIEGPEAMRQVGPRVMRKSHKKSLCRPFLPYFNHSDTWHLVSAASTAREDGLLRQER